MMIPEVQHARDYNRALPAPIRWAHFLWAVLLWATRPVRAWAGHPRRRTWAVPMLWGIVLALALGRFDGAVARWVRGQTGLSGSGAALSYGVLLASLLIAAVVWIQDSVKRRGLADWAAAFIATALVCRGLAMTIGRPRPMLQDPAYFISPFGQYPLNPEVGIRHAWEFWVRGVSDLWSMPAQDVAYAFVAATVIGALYPRLRGLAMACAAAATIAAIAIADHYPSDIIVGATIGLAAGRTAVRGNWGGRLAARLNLAASFPAPRPPPPSG